MKKVLAFAAALVLVVAFTSCDKKCTCTTKVGGIESTTTFNLDELNEKYKTDYKKCSEFDVKTDDQNYTTCK